MEKKRYYFSTRDLLVMAALAALGGVAGTYINAIGDFFQSFLGFAGTTQWAAGIHVLWLTLAVGLTKKQGAGTITGILKGAVELLSGNTHGLLVVLVDVVAGILVDLGFLPFRNKDRPIAYILAGGLAAASNVFVFQLFASLPADVLAYGALVLIGGVAFVSGMIFAGLLALLLLNALHRAGIVKAQPPQPMKHRAYPIFLACVIVLTIGLGVYLQGALKGPTTVHIGGTVQAPFDYPLTHQDIQTVTREGTLRGATTRYTGIPVRELIARAEPQETAEYLLVKASDGYAFFISWEEAQTNESLLLTKQGKGEDTSYNIVGATNSKAWVRGVSELTVIGATHLEITGALENPTPYNPDDWQFDMDSTNLNLGDETRKLQGAPLGKVLAAMNPTAEANSIDIDTGEAHVSLALADVLQDDDIRLFTVINEANISFAVADMSGEVIAASVEGIEVVSE